MKKRELIKRSHFYGFFVLTLFLFSSLTIKAQDKISLNFSNISLEEAIKKIETSSKYTFFYDVTKTNLSQKVTVNAVNEPIESIVASMLKSTDLNFEIENHQIALINKGQELSDKKLVKISGTVLDDKGVAVVGASVSAKNTTYGTVTDMDGLFSLNVPENSTLEVSYLGYDKRMVPVKKDQKLTITLSENSTLLNEVLVIGYGFVKKSDATGAVDIIKSADFNKGASVSPEALFNGHIAGVQVTPGSGQPGSNTSVRIRGISSISASSEPLYVIDGVPIDNSRPALNIGGDVGLNSQSVNPLSMISSADIESMTVLKDASATAIYGSRGANGVIIIKTKSGKEGSTSLSYSGSLGFSSVSNKISLLDANQYREYVPGANPNVSTDWQDEIFRQAPVYEQNLTLSSGNKNTAYRASISMSDQDGIVIATGVQRYTLRLNVSHKMFDERLLLNVNANNTHSEFQNILEQQTGGADGGIINNALKGDPTQPVYTADGSFNEYAKTVRNPVAMAKQETDKTSGDRFIGNADAMFYFIPKVLSFKTTLGYDVDNSLRKVYQPSTSVVARDVQGRAVVVNSKFSNLLSESYLTFEKTFNKLHYVNFVGGYSWQEFDNYTESVVAQGFVNDNLGADNIGGGTYQNPQNNHEINRLISFYGRLSYTLNDKYLMTATVRRDGSSRFGSNNRWATFPSAAIAWKMKEEGFLKGVELIDDLKLRVSYGVTGNQDIGNFRYSQTYNVNSKQGTYFGSTFYPAYSITGIANPNLKWEETSQFNAGVDFSILKRRLRGSIDVFSKDTKNLLLSVDAIQPAVSSTYLANIGSMSNKGIELTLSAGIVSNDDFDWNANFNVSYTKNKITELYNNKDVIYGTVSGAGASGNTQILRVGEPVGSFYGQKFLRIEGGKEIFESDERTITGKALPDYLFGFTNSFSYKKWDLSFVLRSALGGEIYNNTRAEVSQGSRLPGQNTNLEGANFHRDGGGGIVYSSSRWVEDASFLKLDNLTLGYNFVIAPKVIKSARIYATAQNLVTLTKYTGYDPEVNNQSVNKGINSIGIDYCSYPHARTFIIGLNVNF